MIFTYIALTLIGLIYYFIFYKIAYKNLIFHSIFGSFIFYSVTNFSFEHSIYMKKYRWPNCYLLAVPFFSNTLLSTIFFSYSHLLCRQN